MQIQTVRNELTNTKKDLTEANQKIGEQGKTINDLQGELKNVNAALTNTTKYLINFDRNLRQTNAVMFGVPEEDLLLQKENELTERTFKKELDKVSEILKIVGHKGPLRHYVRLGKKGDKPRPIKVIFHSVNEAHDATSNSNLLKTLRNQKIYIKPDKTKSENAEFKRLGDEKKKYLTKYPTVEGSEPRVILAKGILKLDGLEVDRYKTVQSLF